MPLLLLILPPLKIRSEYQENNSNRKEILSCVTRSIPHPDTFLRNLINSTIPSSLAYAATESTYQS